ncbi:MAG: hypothetical protein JRI35_01415 [Deltaproteobacteria bacterium]|nr:hypothetical protein [Deltaproteobacteria bacterium]MBW1967670.1 hypothetical protein [Deltaproteobacteria bacterium]MBW2098827.1 hypothetical protein [Deltaproteobacteria bacterium]
MNSSPSSSENNPEISVIVPVYNEEPNIEPLVMRLLESLKSMGRGFEIILAAIQKVLE